ncbi:MAG: penicillin-binding transpeptidase domain-containing protein [Terriglobales bacterium]
MKLFSNRGRGLLALLLAALFILLDAVPAQAKTAPGSSKKSSTPTVSGGTSSRKRVSRKKRTVSRSKSYSRLHSRRRSRRRYERFRTSSYAENVTAGDVTLGEDSLVREAAIEALGNMNGTVVAIDPESGRVLAMVNQKLALSEGAQPCSTFKIAVGLAGINEGLITKDTELLLGRTRRRRQAIVMKLTDATARSDNRYFQVLGKKLGFEKVSHYASQFGLGELAGYGIEGEQPGVFPASERAARGGVGLMCSHGMGISMTALQLGAMVSAFANGGSLYYLQHPRTPEEAASFQPRLKRQLGFAAAIPEVSEGMMGAVEYGSAHSLRYVFSEEPVYGKTGTCSKDGTRFGWFASWAGTARARIVTVVFLQGGRPTFGPKAAEIAGRLYRNLYDRNYFTPMPQTASNQGTGQ